MKTVAVEKYPKYFQGSGHDSAEEQAPSVPDYVPTPIGEERGQKEMDLN